MRKNDSKDEYVTIGKYAGKAGMAALFMTILLVMCKAEAAPLLRCEVVYAGSSHVIEAMPGTDPYATKSADIDGRFRFKAVVLGNAEHIEAIKLYAYYETRRQPILIQEAKYLPPFTLSAVPDSLTGHQYLYAPPLGRELQYGCALLEVEP
jgi:hypothetical protein